MRWVVLLALTGCDSLFLPAEKPLCAGLAGQNGTGMFSYCAKHDPIDDRALTQTIDTDADCDDVIPDEREELCIVTGVRITVPTGISVRGQRPLVIFATASIVVGGALNVSSRHGPDANTGAGANSGCGIPLDPAAPDVVTDGGGGGAGGAYEQSGGDGGNGAGSTAGSTPIPTHTANRIRGGCKGGRGGIGGPSGSVSVVGGAGGGAIYLAAHDSITLSGVIEASGEAGTPGGGLGAGGAGGGSGGLIALDAPIVTLASGAKIVANGGPGGGASGSAASAAGLIGAEPRPSTDYPYPSSGGAGGGAATFAAAGGAGGFGTTAAMNGKAGGSGAGGGGGGGSVGVIKIFTTDLRDMTTMTISPPL